MKAPNKVEVNGVSYVRENVMSCNDGLVYAIIRTYSAGVFAGYIKSRDGKEVCLVNARRIWKWVGAATLSQMALHGVNSPDECKFPEAVPEITLTEAIEIIPATEKARESLEGVPIWET